jgi:hypothetical protein
MEWYKRVFHNNFPEPTNIISNEESW